MPSSSNTRDPFPMTSKEAQNLADSVIDSDNDDGNATGDISSGGTWNTMKTNTANLGPKESAIKNVKHHEIHEKKSKNKKKKNKSNAFDDDDSDDNESDDDDDDDKFFDRSLEEIRLSNKNFVSKSFYYIKRFIYKLYIRLYGNDVPVSEMIRSMCLALTLFFMIGGYWLLRSLKDPVLTAICGVTTIPKAKMLSVFVVLGVVSIYNKLLDTSIPKYKLFYIFGTFYFIFFTSIALLLKHPIIGLPNQMESPSRLLGWISYCGIESFGSVMVSLFWSFTNSNINKKTAEGAYGVIVAAAQIGSILGPTIVNVYVESWGVSNIYLIGGICMLLLQSTMFLYISIYGPEERNAPPSVEEKSSKSKQQSNKAGILEGLQLFYKHNYVKGIFAISCLFMIIVTIVDYTMKILARNYFADLHPCVQGMSCYSSQPNIIPHGLSITATESFTKFMGLFGQATNTLSFLMSLLGTSAIIRYLGLRLTLLLFPTMCLLVIIFVRFYPNLYVVFGAMMILKASSYSLNNPTKEILYQPTSSAVKYKAKSWIDIFGARGSKALGSVVTNTFSTSATSLISNGSLVGMAVATFLIWNANFMGKKYDEYIISGYIVGEDDELDTLLDEVTGNGGRNNMIIGTDENDDVPDQETSCALNDDEHDDDDDDDDEDNDDNEAIIAKV